MKNQYRIVVIGGGVVGASVFYHIAKQGWTDIALIERKELTAGSTWHAAAGFHPLNNDINIASLQAYTIRLYEQIEKESGQDVGIKMCGSVDLAGTAQRLEYLKHMRSVFMTLGVESFIRPPNEISKLCPIVDTTGILGGLHIPYEGHLDPHGCTIAYVKATQKRGGEVILRNQVIDLNYRKEGAWDVVTEQGTIIAEHVINAGGLWARKVGMMAGVNLPVTPMEHHYLVTEEIPAIAEMDEMMTTVVDLEGFTYMRQERTGALLGLYELNPKHWYVEGAPWDYGMELIPEDIDRIMPELQNGFSRFPVLQEVGIRRWVNGAFTFTPDGNPLVGPVPGLRNYWVACGVMAGFSQGGGVGLALAQWLVEGETEMDVFGMDVARYGDYASDNKYLKDMTRQFYTRRFVLTYPNEELPAGRPLTVSPAHEIMQSHGAQFSCIYSLEVPLYFTTEENFVETPTLRRSNAFELVGEESNAVRNNVAIVDTTGFSRYEVSGPGAEQWLNVLLACRLPRVGGMRLAPMLTHAGKLAGDLTVLRISDDRFWLMGSYYLQNWHMRWFNDHKPKHGVKVSNLVSKWAGIAITGPNSRNVLAKLVQEDVSNTAFRFMNCREFELQDTTAIVGRVAVTGELGYEINVLAKDHKQLYQTVLDTGNEFGIRQFGFRAMNSLRLEKSFGAWSREFTAAYTPGMSGLDRFIDFSKENFIGQEAAKREQENLPEQRLVLLEIDSADTDVHGFEPVFCKEIRTGFITSGAYGYEVQKSLGLAYVGRQTLQQTDILTVHVAGEPCTAKVLTEAPYDPAGLRMRQ